MGVRRRSAAFCGRSTAALTLSRDGRGLVQRHNKSRWVRGLLVRIVLRRDPPGPISSLRPEISSLSLRERLGRLTGVSRRGGDLLVGRHCRRWVHRDQRNLRGWHDGHHGRRRADGSTAASRSQAQKLVEDDGDDRAQCQRRFEQRPKPRRHMRVEVRQDVEARRGRNIGAVPRTNVLRLVRFGARA